MTPEQRETKLALIARLSREEIEGWRWAVRKFRAPFDGEAEALAMRERELGPASKPRRRAA